MADVTRFVEGYDRDFERALGEIDAGRKRSHWMWYLFPQIRGLGSSPTAEHYAIADRAEAEAFLTDPALGPAYGRLVNAVWQQVVNNGISVQSPVRHALTTRSSCPRSRCSRPSPPVSTPRRRSPRSSPRPTQSLTSPPPRVCRAAQSTTSILAR